MESGVRCAESGHQLSAIIIILLCFKYLVPTSTLHKIVDSVTLVPWPDSCLRLPPVLLGTYSGSSQFPQALRTHPALLHSANSPALPCSAPCSCLSLRFRLPASTPGSSSPSLCLHLATKTLLLLFSPQHPVVNKIFLIPIPHLCLCVLHLGFSVLSCNSYGCE